MSLQDMLDSLTLVIPPEDVPLNSSAPDFPTPAFAPPWLSPQPLSTCTAQSSASAAAALAAAALSGPPGPRPPQTRVPLPPPPPSSLRSQALPPSSHAPALVAQAATPFVAAQSPAPRPYPLNPPAPSSSGSLNPPAPSSTHAGPCHAGLAVVPPALVSMCGGSSGAGVGQRGFVAHAAEPPACGRAAPHAAQPPKGCEEPFGSAAATHGNERIRCEEPTWRTGGGAQRHCEEDAGRMQVGCEQPASPSSGGSAAARHDALLEAAADSGLVRPASQYFKTPTADSGLVRPACCGPPPMGTPPGLPPTALPSRAAESFAAGPVPVNLALIAPPVSSLRLRPDQPPSASAASLSAVVPPGHPSVLPTQAPDPRFLGPPPLTPACAAPPPQDSPSSLSLRVAALVGAAGGEAGPTPPRGGPGYGGVVWRREAAPSPVAVAEGKREARMSLEDSDWELV